MMYLFSVTYNCKEIWVIAQDKEAAITKAIAYYARLGKTVKGTHLYVRPMTYQKKPMCVDGFHRDGDKLMFTVVVDDNNAAIDDIRFGSTEVQHGI